MMIPSDHTLISGSTSFHLQTHRYLLHEMPSLAPFCFIFLPLNHFSADFGGILQQCLCSLPLECPVARGDSGIAGSHPAWIRPASTPMFLVSTTESFRFRTGWWLLPFANWFSQSKAQAFILFHTQVTTERQINQTKYLVWAVSQNRELSSSFLDLFLLLIVFPRLELTVSWALPSSDTHHAVWCSCPGQFCEAQHNWEFSL